jgi:hypothetical protein
MGSRLADALVEGGLVTRPAVALAEARRRDHGGRLSSALERRGRRPAPRAAARDPEGRRRPRHGRPDGPDRPRRGLLDEVLARVQGMLTVMPALVVFLDVASLRSGQQWARRILEEVPTRDVSSLFWSDAARRSEWVERAWRCALEERGIESIDPVPLVSPAPAPPPAELVAHLHFNDWMLAFARGPAAR